MDINGTVHELFGYRHSPDASFVDDRNLMPDMFALVMETGGEVRWRFLEALATGKACTTQMQTFETALRINPLEVCVRLLQAFDRWPADWDEPRELRVKR